MIAARLKSVACRLSDSKLFDPIVHRMERRNHGRALLRVLAYHRIDERRSEDPCYPGLISTTPVQFAAQMECLAARYRVCSMDEVLQAAAGKLQLPTDAVLLTFDDATRDFATHAWPVLQSLNLPATVFVPTAYPDQPAHHFWWDRLHRALMHSADGTAIRGSDHRTVVLTTTARRQTEFRRLKEQLKQIPHHQFQTQLQQITDAANVADPPDNNVLSWADLKRLHSDGLTLAPHTHTHPMLNQLPADEVQAEVRQSLQMLSDQVGSPCPVLAYPAGGVSGAAAAATSAAGVQLAFTTQRGLNDQSFSQPMRLKRINVGARTSIGLLRTQLANWGR